MLFHSFSSLSTTSPFILSIPVPTLVHLYLFYFPFLGRPIPPFQSPVLYLTSVTVKLRILMDC